MFGLQLGDMEYQVNADSSRQTKHERGSRGLGNNGKGANFPLCKFAGCPIGLNIIGPDKYSVTNTEWWWAHVVLVSNARHGVLGILHTVAKELVNFVKVDSEVLGT